MNIICFVFKEKKKWTFCFSQARGTSSYLHFVVSHLFYGTPFRLKYCSVVYNVCLMEKKKIYVCLSPPPSPLPLFRTNQNRVTSGDLTSKVNLWNFVICKTINKHLSSSLTSLKSFIEMEDIYWFLQSNYSSLSRFWFCSTLAQWQSNKCQITDAIRKPDHFYPPCISLLKGENLLFLH